MQADIDNLRSLRVNRFAAVPEYGETPQTTFTRYLNSWQGIGLGIVLALLLSSFHLDT